MVGFCVDVGSEPGKASEKLTFVKGKWRGVETPRGSRVSAGRMGAMSSVVQALACFTQVPGHFPVSWVPSQL